MGHADHYFLNVQRGGGIDDGIQGRNGILAAFEGEPLLTDVFGMEEFLEHNALVELFHDPALLFQGKGVQEFMLHFIGEPVDLFLFADVFELDADMTGIALLQMFEDLAQGGSAEADQVARIESSYPGLLR